jgi:polysaccharide biosynthesis protein PslG
MARRLLLHLASCWLVLCFLSACAGTPSPRLPAGASDWKKVEFAILEDYDKGEDLAEVARDFDLFKQLGVTVWRGSFGWDDYEPSRGTYDFEWLHRFADLAASRGITLRPYLAYTPEWAAAGGSDKDAWNDPPKDVEEWYRFVRALSSAMRRHRNVVSYEIYNEENVRMWWDGTREAYEDALRRGTDAVEAGNPDADVILGGMVYPDVDWIEAVCEGGRSGRRVDVIPFHAYPETWTPENVTVENYLGKQFASGFVSSADAACGRKRLSINETGYATLPGRTEEDQARWWIRAAATFLAQPRIDHLGIYEIKDLRPDREAIGDAPNYHLGITYTDRRRKLAFTTLQRLVSLLGTQSIATIDARDITSSPSAADVYRYLFQGADGRQFLFLWTRRDAAVATISSTTPGTEMIEYSIGGAPSGRLDFSTGKAEVTLRAGDVRMFERRPARSR